MRAGQMRVVVTGARGRLGAAIHRDFGRRGHRVAGLTRQALDITDRAAVTSVLEALRPDVIINCCAYNAVDAAEADRLTAFAVNAEGPAALAETAARLGAVLVHYSTDFVFDGTAREPYTEDAPPRPANVYGASKLAGEQAVYRVLHHYVLRVESLFGGNSGSGQQATVDYLADTLERGMPVRAITDRTVTPSYVSDVVDATRALLERCAPFGIYHCVASDPTTWHELADQLACWMDARDRVIPVRAEDFPTIAPRPRFCALSNRKLQDLGIELPDWRDAVRRHLAARRLSRSAPVRHAQIA